MDRLGKILESLAVDGNDMDDDDLEDRHREAFKLFNEVSDWWQTVFLGEVLLTSCLCLTDSDQTKGSWRGSLGRLVIWWKEKVVSGCD